MTNEEKANTILVGVDIALEPDGKLNPHYVGPAVSMLLQKMAALDFDGSAMIRGSVVDETKTGGFLKALRLDAVRVLTRQEAGGGVR